MIVPLDHMMSAAANAAQLYKKARKQRRAADNIKPLLAAAEDQVRPYPHSYYGIVYIAIHVYTPEWYICSTVMLTCWNIRLKRQILTIYINKAVSVGIAAGVSGRDCGCNSSARHVYK